MAIVTCEAGYPLLDKDYADITEDQLRRLYVFYVEETVACLERV